MTVVSFLSRGDNLGFGLIGFSVGFCFQLIMFLVDFGFGLGYV